MENLKLGSSIALLFLLLLHSSSAFGSKKCVIDTHAPSEALDGAPEIVDGSDPDEYFTVHQNVTLYCCFKSKQPFQVKWYKNGLLLTKKARYVFGENDQVLSIADGSMTDSGAYRCEASNKNGGRESHDIKVTMKLPECKNAPNIDSNQRIVKVKKEERVILKCFSKLRNDCRESISLNYYWINPQGQLVSSNSSTVIRRNNRVRMKMIIKHAQKSDSGNYTCLAKRQSKKAELTVLLKVE